MTTFLQCSSSSSIEAHASAVHFLRRFLLCACILEDGSRNTCNNPQKPRILRPGEIPTSKRRQSHRSCINKNPSLHHPTRACSLLGATSYLLGTMLFRANGRVSSHPSAPMASFSTRSPSPAAMAMAMGSLKLYGTLTVQARQECQRL